MPNLGQLAALTMQNYRKTLADNVTKQTALLNQMEAKGMIDIENGGREIVVPVMTGLSTSVGTYQGTSPINNPYQEGIDAATYSWAHYEAGVAISKTDELLNSGEFAIKKLLKTKIMQAEKSLKERLESDLFDGAGTSGTPAAEIVGLQTLVAATGTVGSINGTTETFWRSYVEATSTALTVAHIRTMANTIDLLPGGKVNTFMTTQTLHEKYEGLLTATIQMQSAVSADMRRLGDAGFNALGFRGTPVLASLYCPSGEFYAITDALKLVKHRDANFDLTDYEKVQGQMVFEQFYLLSCALTVDNRRKLGKLTNKT